MAHQCFRCFDLRRGVAIVNGDNCNMILMTYMQGLSLLSHDSNCLCGVSASSLLYFCHEDGVPIHILPMAAPSQFFPKPPFQTTGCFSANTSTLGRALPLPNSLAP